MNYYSQTEALMHASTFCHSPDSENTPSDVESMLSSSEFDNGKATSSSDVDQLMECILYLEYGFIHSHNLVTHCHFPMFQQNGTSVSIHWPQRMRLEKGIGKPIYPN